MRRAAKYRASEPAVVYRRRGTSSPPSQGPPLVDTASPSTAVGDAADADKTTAAVSPKDPDQHFICVSPSWEAHGRRRKEKMKEEAARTGRKSRLSKQPLPDSSVDALKRAEGADPDARVRLQDRPAGAATKGSDKGAAPRKPRSRSNSFVSLIRSSLAFRRPSADPAPETEFVGGIKLERERHLANDRALDQQAKPNEASVHPALRDDAKSSRGPSEPLRSPPPGRGPASPRAPPSERTRPSPATTSTPGAGGSSRPRPPPCPKLARLIGGAPAWA